MTAPTFDAVESHRFPELVRLFACQAERHINMVHLHHTYIPDQALFDDLTRQYEDEEAAGLELCRRMWRYHVQDLGWSDIAQHVTIDPTGRIWLNRSWNRPPASASGFNGSAKLGPFMIEMIGNFDKGQETPTKPQRQAMLTVMAAVQHAFELQPDAFAFHNEMTDKKSCPGTSMDKAALIKELSKQHVSLKTTKKEAAKEGPLDDSQTIAYRLLSALLTRSLADGGRALAPTEIAAELEENEMSLAARARLTEGTYRSGARSAVTRGGGNAEPALTPAMRRELKRHVINLRQGEFSNDGDFTTSLDEADALVNQHLDRWVQDKLAANETPRVMIHAHGGLTSEDAGLAYAYTMYDWWKQQGVYPIFFVWETGTIESIWQLIEEKFGTGARGAVTDFLSDTRDAAVEFAMRQFGRNFWNIMKISAERASNSEDRFGGFYLAKILSALFDKHQQKIEFHTVGHSAGAIFQAYFMREFSEGSRQVPIQTAQYLAPACTIDLFKELVLPRVKNGSIQHFNLYTMDRMTERDDPTVPGYGKSLLYLVSRGFETRREMPVLGLEESIVDDPDMVEFFGLGGTAPTNARLILSPSGDGVPDNSKAGSTTHGGFDNDQQTMTSVALRILGTNDAGTVPTVPQLTSASRGSQRLFAPLSSRLQPDVYRQLFAPQDVQTTPSRIVTPDYTSSTSSLFLPSGQHGSGSGAGHRDGNRYGLCIGIDDYPDHMRLSGCVNDAESWADLFGSLDFDVELLRNGEATYQGILDAMNNVIRRARPGDIVAIQYAGHGAQFPDATGDEVDGKDEALVPFDHNTRGIFLSDDELWPVLQGGAAGTTIAVFMDCCHSASNSRAAPKSAGPGKARKFEPTPEQHADHVGRMRMTRASRGLMSKMVSEMTHIKFAACRDNQEAFEENGQGKFTVAAIRAIRDSLGQPSAASNDQMRLTIERALEFEPRQTPDLEASVAGKEAAFLGGIRR